MTPVSNGCACAGAGAPAPPDSSTAAPAIRRRSSPRSPSAISRSSASSSTASASSGGPSACSGTVAANCSTRAPGDQRRRLRRQAWRRPGSARAGRSPARTARADGAATPAVASNASAASPAAAGGGVDSRPNPSSVSAGASMAWPSAAATPTDSATSRRSMSTNKPDSGRLDQSALAVTWNSTMRPAPLVASVTSGVPSRQRRPGVRGEIGARLGQHLAVDRHLGRHRQPGERRAGGERRQPGRLAPGHRAAQLAVAAQQLHRQQRVGLADRLLGGARAGEADQQAALLHPTGHRVALRPGRQRVDRPGSAPTGRAAAASRSCASRSSV